MILWLKVLLHDSHSRDRIVALALALGAAACMVDRKHLGARVVW